MKRMLLAALVALASACAPVPRPPILSEVDAVQQGAAAKEARDLAPLAYARAEKHRKEAHAAYEAGDVAGAQLHAEWALAAYAHAHTLARVARAETDAKSAEAELASRQAELSSLDGEQSRATAEVAALEARIKVARDAQPVAPSGPADAAREKARVAAARSLALEARMLCTAARLLLPEVPAPKADTPAPIGAPTREALVAELDEAELIVKKLDESLAQAGPAPIDLATRGRSTCLSALTGMRRAMTPVTRAPGAGDALLGEISATRAFSPSRDDRGIVITLRNLFAGDKLTPAATEQITRLGKLAAQNPRFPLAVVVHQDKEPSAKEQAAVKARADAVATALRGANAPRVDVVLAGAASPVVDPAGSDRARNARVEIVFVTPETF
ncbi:hypothetical protein [Polyangium sp. 15x6]|uniref:hypothetical protein n=1 Tax=Polyangium sp. 15x6 TaxID=3042687 RepID=UPI00249C7322|nr:hypothetical protein [Polyangium sp. 15x6]MDI3286235.1 hypothetical protein [Polyangium sp. 15x6]